MQVRKFILQIEQNNDILTICLIIEVYNGLQQNTKTCL